jgi:hypothetical protein
MQLPFSTAMYAVCGERFYLGRTSTQARISTIASNGSSLGLNSYPTFTPCLMCGRPIFIALQKAVFLKLNQTEMLRNQIAIDSQLPGGYYKQAWVIVNFTETEYLKYVSALSAENLKKP